MNRSTVLVAAFLAVAACGAALASAVSGPRELPVPPGIPRVSFTPVGGDAPGAARDFVVAGDSLLVLDAEARRVYSVRGAAGAWRAHSSFGGRGSGPGELNRPTALAVSEGGVVVAESGGRLSFFGPDGSFRSAVSLRLPCALPHPQLVSLGNDLAIAGNCASGRATSGDTLNAILWVRQGDDGVREIGRAPRLTLDGGWGSMYAAPRSVTEADDGLFFGVGLSRCVLRFRAIDARGAEECAPSLRARTASEPTGLRRGHGRAYRWPDEMAFYIATIETPSGTVFVRPHTADSVVFELVTNHADGESRPLLAAPFASFVGCRRGGCLWFAPTDDGGRAAFVTSGRIRALAAAS